MKRTMMILLLVSVVVPFSVCLPGCNEADIQALKEMIGVANQQSDAYTKIMQDANSQLTEAKKQANALPPGKDRDEVISQVVQLQSIVDSASNKVKEFQAALSLLNSQMANTQDTAGVIEAFSVTAGTVAPQPYGLLLALVGTTIAGFLRAAQNRAAGRNLAASLEPILTYEQKAALKKASSQSATAKTIVNEVQGDAVKRIF